MRPERIVAINLDRRTDRWADFSARWQAAVGDVEVQRFPAVDLPQDPMRGCWLSHMQVLRSAGPAPLLVLEDDAVFAHGFSLQLPEPPPGWQLLRLGGWLYASSGTVGDWVRVERIAHTHAYVVADPGWLADWVTRRAHQDTPRAISRGVPGHYRLSVATVGQAAGHSDVYGTQRAEDQYWEQQ